jgi:hypothetical protein
VFVDCSSTPVQVESAEGASVWEGPDAQRGLTACTSGVDEGVLIGILVGGVGFVVKLTNEDALWFGRRIVDLANA